MFSCFERCSGAAPAQFDHHSISVVTSAKPGGLKGHCDRAQGAVRSQRTSPGSKDHLRISKPCKGGMSSLSSSPMSPLWGLDGGWFSTHPGLRLPSSGFALGFAPSAFQADAGPSLSNANKQLAAVLEMSQSNVNNLWNAQASLCTPHRES